MVAVSREQVEDLNTPALPLENVVVHDTVADEEQEALFVICFNECLYHVRLQLNSSFRS